MTLRFTKMNGAGNDFVLMDNREGKIRLTREQVVRLCHRQRGVGADGVLMVIPCASGNADWAWEFYNSDGSSAEMCGNGARCFARYVQRLTGSEGLISFETGAGVVRSSFQGERVTVTLTEPADLQLDQTVQLTASQVNLHCLNTGVPHVVLFVEDADKAMVLEWGREIRFHSRFAPQGTNVNFVEVKKPGTIRVRTYERGVEGETLACGTGVTAAAILSAQVYHWAPPVQVQVQGGGSLEVNFAKADNATGVRDVRLTGPADFVFEGRIELQQA